MTHDVVFSRDEAFKKRNDIARHFQDQREHEGTIPPARCERDDDGKLVSVVYECEDLCDAVALRTAAS